MKKLISLLLILILVCALAACGGNEPEAEREVDGERLGRIVVYLDRGLSRVEALAVGRRLRAVAHVTDAAFIDRDEEKEKMRGQLGDEAVRSLFGSGDPLPYAYRITVDSAENRDAVAAELKLVDGVDIVYPSVRE